MMASIRSRWTRWPWVLAALCVVVAGERAYGQATISAAELTDEHVQKAIRAIVDELHRQKDPKHFWDPAPYPKGVRGASKGGWTALTVLALLHAGASYQEPTIRAALDYLEQMETQGTYAVALRAMVWAMLPDERFHELLVADARLLMDGFRGETSGWNYWLGDNPRHPDNSNTQFAALGLWEAAKRDVDVEPRIWERLEERFIQQQRNDGGWNYAGGSRPSSGSMTTAGLGLLFITQDRLHAGEHVTIITKPPSSAEEAIKGGLNWLGGRFSPSKNPGAGQFAYFFYYLYGVERVGLASGYRFFGERDWFREGAAELIQRICVWDPQTRTMSVGAGWWQQPANHPLRFALLFLSRGRVPVAINKLRDPSMRWNNRPRDVANLTRWISDRTEMALNWQIVDIDRPPHEWLTAPLLYLASDEALPWVPARRAEVDEYVRQWQEWNSQRATGEVSVAPKRPGGRRLDAVKEYLDLGGMILAVNEGNTQALTRSVEAAGRLMYPQYEWRTLEPEDWAYTTLIKVPGPRLRLRRLSNGVRDLIVLAPDKLSRTLQALNHQRRFSFIWDLGANIYLYASEKNRPRPRLAPHVFQGRASGNAARSATIVRAIHAGNWNPEPKALDIFAAWMRERDIKVRIEYALLSQVQHVRPRPELVMVSGVKAHEFSEPEREALRSFLSAGGTVLFETAGGRGEFARSAERMVMSVFEVRPDPLVHERVVTGRGLPGAQDLTRIEYRPYSFDVFKGIAQTLRLSGATVDGRTCLFFSRQDISNGLLDQPCWGVHGYSPQSARAVLANVLLNAMAGPDAGLDR